MTLATSNRTQLRAILESAFGVIPGTGNCRNVRSTDGGGGLGFSLKSDTSKEIRDDRQVTDLVLTGASAQGAVGFELSYREYDDFIQAALMGTWAEYGTNGVGAALALDINSTAGTLTAAVAPTGANAFSNLEVGQWFRLTAPGDAADGAYLKLAAKTTTELTVNAATPIPGTGSRLAVAACQISSSRLKNGVTERSFSLERAHSDINQFFAYRGMTLSKMSMSYQSGNIVTGSFDFTGKDSVRSGATQLPGSPVASRNFDIMNAVSGVGNILENGSPLTGTFIKSLKFDVDNKLRARDAIGTLGAVSIGAGTLEVKGEMEIYLADGTLYDKFINNTASSITWSSKDNAGNGYVNQFPKVKFSDAKVNSGSLDQDAMLSVPFTALMDPVTGKTMIIDRLGVV